MQKVDGDDDNYGKHADGDHNDHCDYNDDEEDDAEADICTWLRQLVPAPFTSYLLAPPEHKHQSTSTRAAHHQSTRAQEHKQPSPRIQGRVRGQNHKHASLDRVQIQTLAGISISSTCLARGNTNAVLATKTA